MKKRMSMLKLRRAAAGLLTFFLMAGEIGGGGMKVNAGDDEPEAATEAAADEEDLPAEEGADGLRGGTPITLKVVKINGVKISSGDSGTGWSYNDGVLNLDGFNLADDTMIKNTMYFDNQQYGIYCNGDLDITVTGNCSINMEGATGKAFYGIYTEGDLTIRNKAYSTFASLDINYGSQACGGAGIYCGGDLTMATAKRRRSMGEFVVPKGGMVTLVGSMKITARGTANLGSTDETVSGIRALGSVSIDGAEVTALAGTNKVGNDIAVDVDGDLVMTGGSLTAESAEPSASHYAIGVDVGGNVSTAYASTLKACARDDMNYPGNYVGLNCAADISINGAAVFEAYGPSKNGMAVQTYRNRTFTLGEDNYIVLPDEGMVGAFQVWNTVLDPADNSYASKVQIKKATPYDVWIGGVRIDSENCDDLSAYVTGTDATASYDPVTNTLELKKVTGTSGSKSVNEFKGLIVSKAPIRIVGDATITAADTVDHCVIVDNGETLYLNGKFSFTSRGNAIWARSNTQLIIDCLGNGETVTLISTDSDGVDLGAGMLLKRGSVRIEGKNSGIQSAGALEIQGGNLTVKGEGALGGYGLHVKAFAPDPELVKFTYPDKENLHAKQMDDEYYTVVDGEDNVINFFAIDTLYQLIDDVMINSPVYIDESLDTPVYTSHGGTATIIYSGILGNGSTYGPTEEPPTKVGNYTVTVTEVTETEKWRGSADFMFYPKAVGVSAEPEEPDHVYSGDAYVKLKNVQLHGVGDGDDVKLDSDEVYGMMDDANVGSDKPVKTVELVGLTGADAYNYTLYKNLSGVTVNVIKDTITDLKQEMPVEAGTAYNQDLSYDLVEDASFGTITILEGEDQLDTVPSFIGNVLSWKMKAELSKIVKLEIKVNGGTNYNDYKVIFTMLVPHNCAENLEKVDKEEPDCIHKGHEAYYECQICHKIYEDAEGTKEITDPDTVIIPAKGHILDNGEVIVQPTTETDGLKRCHCINCDYTEDVVIPKGTILHSALDPVPENLDTATELYLVKGQKFTLTEKEWTIPEKADKKVVSVSNKGLLKAKKPGTATIKNKDGSRTIKITVSLPTIQKKLSVNVGEEAKLIEQTYDNDHLQVYWFSASPDVATVDQKGYVHAVAKGTAKITAYINGSAYKCSVTVKEPTIALTRDLHLNVGLKKNVSIKGMTAWEGGTENVASAKKKTIIAGTKPGTAIFTTKVGETIYTLNVIVEDPTLKSITSEDATLTQSAKNKYKYDLTIKAGKKVTLAYESMSQPVVYKCTKPEIAFVDEYGAVDARTAGKAKFTAKINGKTVTINVVVKE